tara:strand:+ start:511 stop:1551 length:1041 start_codon:yes stop_codon:yes gene_type:complete
MNFKDLYNQKNKKDLLQKIENEPFDRITLSFYKYTKLKNLDVLRDELYLKWKDLNILGRVYLATEGINAQISIPENLLTNFKNELKNTTFLNKINLNNAVLDGLSFLKLVVKVKKEIVAYGLNKNDYDIDKTGKHLDYNEFNKSIDEGAIVIDVRNYYEGEVGKFENAIVPDVSRSKELLPEIKKLLKNNKDDKILMYCTGGIRCEKASSYLIKQGFTNVNQLKGGIIKYANDIKKNNVPSKFIGKNFVFDHRMGEKITSDIISLCHQCDNSCDEHTNCRNQSCHILFIQCQSCKSNYNGCCSKQCSDFTQLPKEKQKELFKSGKIKFTAQKSREIKPKLKKIYSR